MKKQLLLLALLLSITVPASAGFSIPGNSDSDYESLFKPKKKKKKNNFAKKRGVGHGHGGGGTAFGVGVQSSALKLLGNKMLIGFGLNGLYAPGGGKNAFFTDFTYYMPGIQTSTDYGYAYSSLTEPSEVTVQVQTKITGFGFRIGYKRYLIHEVSEEGFKMYFQAAVGVMAFKGTNTTTGYDKSEYYTVVEPVSAAVGYPIGGGLGFEYSIRSKINIYLEGNINIPANTVNGEQIEVQIPVSAQGVFGLRYHF
ncbi:MAG: hypothetical protein JST26_06390 [Bacteroidetes bacterium]|nr:hypothetical protein [Bacteroidota bacterium]